MTAGPPVLPLLPPSLVRRLAELPSVPSVQSPREPVFIPEPAACWPLHRFNLSFDTRFFLDRHNFWQARDLRDRSLAEIRALPECTIAILEEIRRIVAGIHMLFGLTPAQMRADRLAEPRTYVLIKHPRLRPPKSYRTRAARVKRVPLPERFSVPESLRNLEPWRLPLPFRASLTLIRHNIRRLGDLDGRLTRDFREPGECGVGSLARLHEIIQQKAEGGHFPADVVLAVSPACRDLAVEHLPATVRLRHLFHTAGIVRLGDLHDCVIRRIKAVKNTGHGTLKELQALLQRAEAGEFFPPPAAGPWSPADLFRRLDTLLAQLPPPQRQVLQLRYGADGGPPRTLDATNRIIKRTRERVRQIQAGALRRLFQAGSYPLLDHGERLRAFGRETGSPLTVAQVQAWLGTDTPAARPAPGFYVRLLRELFPGLPVEQLPKAHAPAKAR